MISKNGNKFNCCESVLLRINEKNPLPDFNSSTMRIASNFGGGLAGWGSACGAVSGATMAIGLLFGTEGSETPEDYESKREFQRTLTQKFMKAFEEEWGTIKCLDLLGVDFRTPEGKEIYELMKLREETHCPDYVTWSAEKVLKMIKDYSENACRK